jgi:hypothetical protein
MPMKVAVQDANVLIDLELAALFDLWFQLGIETHTTSLIRLELEKGAHDQAMSYFTSGQVHEHDLSFAQLTQVAQLEREVGSKARFNDCSVLFLARKLDVMLLSCDKALRAMVEILRPRLVIGVGAFARADMASTEPCSRGLRRWNTRISRTSPSAPTTRRSGAPSPR